MRVLGVATLIVLLAAPAYGQMPNVNLMADPPPKSPDEIEREQARDKAYKDTLKKIPDAKASSDPWGGLRSADAPKAPKTAAKAKAKSGANPN